MKKRDRNIGSQTQFNAGEILEELRAAEDGLSVKDFAHILGLNRSAQKQLTTLLNRLQGTGIIKRAGNLYQLSKSNRALIGTIRQRRRKSISFIPDDVKERLRGRIDVAPDEVGGAFDGDQVIAFIKRPEDRERVAKVEMLLKRGDLKVVGRLQCTSRSSFVESLDDKFPFDIDVEIEDKNDDGKIVVVQVTRYPSTHSGASGLIVERLGAYSTDPGLDIEIIIRKHDLPYQFPPEVEQETESISDVVTDDQLVGRLDLRNVLTVTIDGETARDFDDAISLEKLANGNYSLGVHIADVSFYVRAGTALDEEAYNRGTSVYFPERAVPMLPEKLSNGICSLNPKADRLAMSALMEVDKSGQVISYRLAETVIHSSERMTYTDVNKILNHSDQVISERYQALSSFFTTLEELARILIRMRQERGAIDFNLPEAVFRFNDEGHIAGVIKADRNIAHRIIEEFMLLANETVASHLEKLGIPSLYRVHELPDPQRVSEFAELAAAFGYSFPVNKVRSHDYQHLSNLLRGKPEEKVMSYAMLRSLQRARYAADNVGHFGLAAPTYTHFTSPIRRYPDLLVHRILRAMLQKSISLGESSAVKKKSNQQANQFAPIRKSDLHQMALESSERERNADAAERELEVWRKSVLMAQKLGEQFSGIVINVKEFGFFVELDELFIEGLVPVATLIDDYYEYDKRRQALVGKQKKRQYKLGDRLDVIITKVNIDRHLVEFSAAHLHDPRKSQKR